MLLAEQTPAWFIAFDLLALGDTSYLDRPYDERRAALVDALASAGPPVYTTPVTDDPARATEWFETFEGAGLDGVLAKPPGGVYAPDQRTLYKIKHTRTADCVVAGFRWHKSGPVVGSLLLGLYDNGRLQHVGVIGAFSAARRKELVEELAPYRTDTAAHPWYGAEGAHDAPPGDGAPTPDRTPRAAETSRWNTGKDLSFEALRPELVVEVGYDHMEGTRFRHTAQFKRWRPDRTPESCTFDQLERPVAYDLDAVLSAGEPVRVPPPAGTPQA
jgi:ATP-dependent DNA ligase